MSNEGEKTVQLEDQMCPEEKKLREELALCYRVCHKFDLCEGTSNHLSVCLDKQDAILTLPYGVLWSTVRPEDFVLIDFNGKILRESARSECMPGHKYVPDITAVKIHCCSHRILGNGRAKAVFHTHQHQATVLDCLDKNWELQMIHQNSARFHDTVGYMRVYDGIAESMDAGENIANHMLENPNCRVLQMCNHGIVVAGASCAEALEDIYYFEKACRLQVEVMGMRLNAKDCAMSDEMAAKVHKQTCEERERTSKALFNAWWQAGV